jgi:hypothetical protein
VRAPAGARITAAWTYDHRVTRLDRMSPGPRRVSPEDRKLLVTLIVLLAIVFAFVASNVAANHEPEPHGLPVGVVGSPHTTQAVAGQLERRAPGGFDVRAYATRAEARTAILHRRIYGAFLPRPQPTLLVASAAGLAPEQALRKGFKAATPRTLVVRDLVPLPRSDSNGETTFSVMLSLTIAGVLGTSVIYLVTRTGPLTVRLVALLTLATGAGLATALATNVVVGAFPGHFLAVWAVATLFVLALALPIAAFQILLGIGGTGVGFVVFLVVGNPSAGSGTAPALLPRFWRAVSQLLPPGAGTTAIRNAVYFDGHGTTRALLVLAGYAVLGATGAIAADRLRARAARRARRARDASQRRAIPRAAS